MLPPARLGRRPGHDVGVQCDDQAASQAQAELQAKCPAIRSDDDKAAGGRGGYAAGRGRRTARRALCGRDRRRSGRERGVAAGARARARRRSWPTPLSPSTRDLLADRGRLAEGGRQLRRGLRPHRCQRRSGAGDPRDEHARRPHKRDGRAGRHADAGRRAPGRRGRRDRARATVARVGAGGLPRTRACRCHRRPRGLRAHCAARCRAADGLRRPPALHLALASDGIRARGALRAGRAPARGRFRERARSPHRGDPASDRRAARWRPSSAAPSWSTPVAGRSWTRRRSWTRCAPAGSQRPAWTSTSTSRTSRPSCGRCRIPCCFPTSGRRRHREERHGAPVRRERHRRGRRARAAGGGGLAWRHDLTARRSRRRQRWRVPRPLSRPEQLGPLGTGRSARRAAPPHPGARRRGREDSCAAASASP